MSEIYDLAIVGAGPAGMSAAAQAAKRGLKHILFERNQIANTIYNYQARKFVMAEPKKLPLRSPLQFDIGSREQILENWNRGLAEHKVHIKRADVTSITKDGESFKVVSKDGEILARRVILAMGVQGTPNKLKVPGEELSHITYTLSDPDAHSGKNILVVGAGDAAIENALALCEKNKVSLLNLSDDFPRAKEANATKILNAIKAGQMKMYAHSSVAKIQPTSCILNTPGGEIEVLCDLMIIRVGGTLPRKFLESCGITFPSADPFSVPSVNSKYESNIPGIYILGALIGYPLIKQAMNQGFEVVENIVGNEIAPADQDLIEQALRELPGTANENLALIRKSIPLFQELSDPQYRELVIESKIHRLPSGSVVFEKNDYTDTFFNIISGGAQIELPDNRKISIQSQNFFGEMGLLSGRRRSARVRTTEDSILLESPRKQILKLMKSVPSVKAGLDRAFVLRALESSVFPDTDPAFLKGLAEKAKLKTFKKNEDLFKEGDTGDYLYVVRKGSVKISKRNSRGAFVTLTYVPAGHVVGEMALLSSDPLPRTATASAAVTCETIVIEKNDFSALLNQNPVVRQRIEAIANMRRIENLKSDLSLQAGGLLDFMVLEGATDADNILVIDSDHCVGCDNCEKACAATHGGTSRLDRKGGKSFASIQIPISCRHCENPLCMVDCPPDALTRQPNGEVVILDSCIGCGNCVQNCPYGVIQLVHDEKKSFSIWDFLGFSNHKGHKEKTPAKAAKCDLCSTISGGPACVRSCPTGAAIRINPKELVQTFKDVDAT